MLYRPIFMKISRKIKHQTKENINTRHGEKNQTIFDA